MGRRPAKIKAEIIWETSDDPNAILPWVMVTKMLMKGQERRKVYMELLEKEYPALYLVENLVSFARHQEDTIFYAQTCSRTPFRVEVPLDMVRKNKGLWYIRETSGRAHAEPLNSLTELAEHYLLTHSLDPKDYSEITKNAAFTLALLSQFLTQSAQNQCDEPFGHNADALH